MLLFIRSIDDQVHIQFCVKVIPFSRTSVTKLLKYAQLQALRMLFRLIGLHTFTIDKNRTITKVQDKEEKRFLTGSKCCFNDH